jgi:hypothetical protein
MHVIVVINEMHVKEDFVYEKWLEHSQV